MIDPANNPLGLLDITPQMAGWDAFIQANLEAMAAMNGVYSGNVLIAGANAQDEFGVETPLQLAVYTVATLPSASPAGRKIFVSDDVGGATEAFSDGTDWRRSYDRAVVS